MNDRVRYFSVSKWREFQHYTDRRPPWIKLHNSLLEDAEFYELSDPRKVHLISMWLLASRLDNAIPDNERYLSRFNLSHTELDIPSLINAGFLEMCEVEIPPVSRVTSAALASYKQDDSPRARPRSASVSDSEALKKEKATALRKQIHDVYEHWRTARSKTDARYVKRIAPRREATIRARLKDGYTVDELKQALDNVALDGWDQRHRHDDIHTLLGSQEKTDKWLDLGSNVAVLSVEQRRERHLATLREGAAA